MDMGGQDLTRHLWQKIREENPHIRNDVDLDWVKTYIKEKKCYVAEDFDAQLKEANDSTKKDIIELPGGGHIKIDIGNLAFRVPEALFQPAKIGKSYAGIHERIYHSINKCDQDIRKDLYKNIVLSGGTTMFRKMQDRLRKEIVALAPSGSGANPLAPAERKYSVWIGGSIIAALGSFDKMWVTKQEFQEAPEWVHIKCF